MWTVCPLGLVVVVMPIMTQTDFTLTGVYLHTSACCTCFGFTHFVTFDEIWGRETFTHSCVFRVQCSHHNDTHMHTPRALFLRPGPSALLDPAPFNVHIVLVFFNKMGVVSQIIVLAVIPAVTHCLRYYFEGAVIKAVEAVIIFRLRQASPPSSATMYFLFFTTTTSSKHPSRANVPASGGG